MVTKLRQVSVHVGQETARLDAIREVRIAEQTYYHYRNQHCGIGAGQLER
jgi:putative transposase